MITRRKTRQIQIGGVKVGGDAPITVQSMTKTDTRDVQATLLEIWALEAAGCEIAELSPDPAGPLFPAQPGGRLSRDAVERLVAKHAATAASTCPSIGDKHVTPHTLRHYVDGWVMWLAAASPLVAEPRVLVPAT